MADLPGATAHAKSVDVSFSGRKESWLVGSVPSYLSADLKRRVVWSEAPDVTAEQLSGSCVVYYRSSRCFDTERGRALCARIEDRFERRIVSLAFARSLHRRFKLRLGVDAAVDGQIRAGDERRFRTGD